MENELQSAQISADEKKHTEYIGLYQHYSGIIFKARASIISGIILSLGYILEVIPHETPSAIKNVIVPLCAALFIPGIFMVEVAYSKRFFEIIYFLKKMEGGNFLFSNYRRVHWQFSVLYFYAVIVFNGICCIRVYSHWDEIKHYEFVLICAGMAASVISLLGIYWDLNHSYHKYFKSSKNEVVHNLFHLLIPSFVTLWFHKDDKELKEKEL